jgi:hypothetical protein
MNSALIGILKGSFETLMVGLALLVIATCGWAVF